MLEHLCYWSRPKDRSDAELPVVLPLPTNASICCCCCCCCCCRPFAEKYADDEAAFFADYAEAHVKLSELGAAWDGAPVSV
jgi:hypothetical protein